MSDASFPITSNYIKGILSNPGSVVHFIGVGGVSMYSLARLTYDMGILVSGSDREQNDRVNDLLLRGCNITVGHSAGAVDNASLVVYSHAISEANPELVRSKELSVPTVCRAEYLGALMLDYSVRIGVSGSHGKSTTVAMLDSIFAVAEYGHTTLSGADLLIGSPYRAGSRDNLLYEACEYKDSFLHFNPTVAICLNVELDHTDYFRDLDHIKSSFASALNRSTDLVLANGDDENVRDLLSSVDGRVLTYGSGEDNDYRFSITSFGDDGYNFAIYKYGSHIGDFHLGMLGEFNIYSATVAIAASVEQGIDIEEIKLGIDRFNGIHGRLEYIGSRYGRAVYLDYAHHPTEIFASINALKSLGGPLTVVFKPHTYSRTAALWDDFVFALSQADYTIVTDIFPARELPIEGITSLRLAEAVGGGAIYSPDDDIVQFIDSLTRGTIVLMGAGNYDKIKKNIVKGL